MQQSRHSTRGRFYGKVTIENFFDTIQFVVYIYRYGKINRDTIQRFFQYLDEKKFHWKDYIQVKPILLGKIGCYIAPIVFDRAKNEFLANRIITWVYQALYKDLLIDTFDIDLDFIASNFNKVKNDFYNEVVRKKRTKISSISVPGYKNIEFDDIWFTLFLPELGGITLYSSQSELLSDNEKLLDQLLFNDLLADAKMITSVIEKKKNEKYLAANSCSALLKQAFVFIAKDFAEMLQLFISQISGKDKLTLYQDFAILLQKAKKLGYITNKQYKRIKIQGRQKLQLSIMDFLKFVIKLHSESILKKSSVLKIASENDIKLMGDVYNLIVTSMQKIKIAFNDLVKNIGVDLYNYIELISSYMDNIYRARTCNDVIDNVNKIDNYLNIVESILSKKNINENVSKLISNIRDMFNKLSKDVLDRSSMQLQLSKIASETKRVRDLVFFMISLIDDYYYRLKGKEEDWLQILQEIRSACDILVSKLEDEIEVDDVKNLRKSVNYIFNEAIAEERIVPEII